MAPAAVGQTEVVEPMIQWFTGKGDFDITQFGEIGQPQPTRLLALPEYDLFFGAIQGFPGLHPTLKGALEPVGETARIAILEILE